MVLTIIVFSPLTDLIIEHPSWGELSFSVLILMPVASRNSESRKVGSGEGTGDGWTLLDLGDSMGLGEDWEGLIDEYEGFGEGLRKLGESGFGDDWLRLGDVDDSRGACSVPCEDTGISLLKSRDKFVKILLIFDVWGLERKNIY